MHFEWNSIKARKNLRKLGITFEEASSVFHDPLAVTGADPDHSKVRKGWSLSECPRRAGFCLWRTPSAVTPSESSTHVSQHNMKGAFMKKVKSTSDELRVEYKRSDFGKLERGKYYKRVKASPNVVILDAEVAAGFPQFSRGQ